MAGNWYDPLVNLGSGAWDWLLDGDNAEGIGGLLSAGGTAFGLFENDQARAGYQGKIPDYTAVREQLPVFDPNRRPGGGGQRYFTDTYYGQTPEDQQAVGSLANAQAAADAQKVALVAQNPEQFARGGIVGALNSMHGGSTGGGEGYGNSNVPVMSSGDRPSSPPVDYSNFTADHWKYIQGIANRNKKTNMESPQGQPKPNWKASSALLDWQNKTGLSNEDFSKHALGIKSIFGNSQPNPPKSDVFTGGTPYFDETTGLYTGGPNAPKSMPPQGMAQGGTVNAMPPAYLNGPSDGMGDQVPAMIDNQRPASLSHGEMVIPADVVSHMGNGNSDAGAKQFYDMMDRVRKARTGNKQQGKQINPNKFIPR